MRVVSSMWVRLLVIVGLAVLLEPQASALSLEDVEKMIKGGVEDITIIQTIQSSGESFTDAEIERYQEAMKSTTPPFSIDVWNAILAKRGSRSGVDTQPQCTVSVQLSERPPSRVWCYFTTAGVGIQQQHVVEFDTAASNSTLRRVNLRRGEDYLFSCSSEPLFKKRILNTHSSPEDVDISWKFHGRNSQVAGYLSSLGWADDVLNDSDSYDEDDVEYAREVMGLSAGSSLVDSDGESTFSRTNRENELSNQLLAGIGPVTKHLISIESDCSGEGVVSGLAPAIYSSLESKNLRLVEVNVKSAPLYSLDDAIANLSTNDISKGEVRSLGVPPALVQTPSICSLRSPWSGPRRTAWSFCGRDFMNGALR